MNLTEVTGYLRFIRRVPQFLRDVVTYEGARSTIRKRLADREEAFLRIVDRVIYQNPRSPYLPLMRIADCRHGDLRNMVIENGLEETLKKLREAGVYVRFEEFKGREPIVRQGREIPVKASDFDNPLLTSFWLNRSSGSTGAPTRVQTDLEMLADLCHSYLVGYAAHNATHVPVTIWNPPSGTQVGLSESKIGMTIDRWFSPVRSRDVQRYFMAGGARRLVRMSARLAGVILPPLEYLPPHRAEVVAGWAARGARLRGKAIVQTTPNLAVRVCAAAKRTDIDLAGVVFSLTGEPTTEAKAREIASAGAESTSYYALAETGVLGLPCAEPSASTDHHLISDLWALITHPRQVPLSGASVDALMFTSLHGRTSKIMLNVEADDFGLVETRRCGCLLGDAGYMTHVSEIYSFSKLTSEGVTLVGNEMIRILEEVLPARFGGSALDYQLLEEEDEDGLSKISIVVSPAIPLENEQEVIDTVLEAMRPIKRGMDRAIFREGSTLRVKRMNPVVTGLGNKLMPLYSDRNRARPGSHKTHNL